MRFVWVTDIPTPYRNHAFERMTRILPEYGIDFEVDFMAWTEPRRTWKFTDADLKFPHRVFSGVHPMVGGVMLHFNPTMLFRLARLKPDVVMVGGYSSPSHMLAPFVVPRGCVRLLGCESNLQSVQRRQTIVRWLKSKIVGRYDAFLVPGESSLAFLRSLSTKVEGAPVVVFPNIIDESVYRTRVSQARDTRASIRQEFGVGDAEQLWVVPARLAAEKGISEFVASMPGDLPVRVLVAGDGPERSSLEAKIVEGQRPVTLLGNVPEATVVRLYAAADVMVLPSLRDPSPLTVVEAIAANLPLFVSNRIGNYADVLTPGENGWTYDPETPAENTAQMRRIAATPRAELERMGVASGALYDANFDSDACVRRLAEQLVSLVNDGVNRGAA